MNLISENSCQLKQWIFKVVKYLIMETLISLTAPFISDISNFLNYSRIIYLEETQENQQKIQEIYYLLIEIIVLPNIFINLDIREKKFKILKIISYYKVSHIR